MLPKFIKNIENDIEILEMTLNWPNLKIDNQTKSLYQSALKGLKESLASYKTELSNLSGSNDANGNKTKTPPIE